jgi:NAD(P)-dependent dehydrogenase (short-subunit alcohol dehydrogenase family)
VAAYGPVDILVNDAAGDLLHPVETFPKKRFDLMMEVQVWAPMHLSQLVLPSMRERKSAGSSTSRPAPASIRSSPTIARRRHGLRHVQGGLERLTTGLASEVYDDNVA